MAERGAYSSRPRERRLVDSGPFVEALGLVHSVLEPRSPGRRPCAILLHGRSGGEDAMWVFAKALPRDWLVVAPRGIAPDPHGGFAWRPRERDEWPTLEQFEEAVGAIRRFVDGLPRYYGADPAQLYFMGFSQGAAAAYATAIRHPGIVKGIVGLVGFVPGRCLAAEGVRALAGLPILMIVGRKDPVIPVMRSRECAVTLSVAGADVEYSEHDVGHKVNPAGFEAIKRWWAERVPPADRGLWPQAPAAAD